VTVVPAWRSRRRFRANPWNRFHQRRSRPTRLSSRTLTRSMKAHTLCGVPTIVEANPPTTSPVTCLPIGRR